jgi:hypothetical protein
MGRYTPGSCLRQGLHLAHIWHINGSRVMTCLQSLERGAEQPGDERWMLKRRMM